MIETSRPKIVSVPSDRVCAEMPVTHSPPLTSSAIPRSA